MKLYAHPAADGDMVLVPREHTESMIETAKKMQQDGWVSFGDIYRVMIQVAIGT